MNCPDVKPQMFPVVDLTHLRLTTSSVRTSSLRKTAGTIGSRSNEAAVNDHGLDVGRRSGSSREPLGPAQLDEPR